MFYIYVLKSFVDKKLYVGYTDNLRRRFKEHNDGKNLSTKNRAPFELVYYEAYKGKTDAVVRERKLKQFKKTYSELKKRLENSL